MKQAAPVRKAISSKKQDGQPSRVKPSDKALRQLLIDSGRISPKILIAALQARRLTSLPPWLIDAVINALSEIGRGRGRPRTRPPMLHFFYVASLVYRYNELFLSLRSQRKNPSEKKTRRSSAEDSDDGPPNEKAVRMLSDELRFEGKPIGQSRLKNLISEYRSGKLKLPTK